MRLLGQFALLLLVNVQRWLDRDYEKRVNGLISQLKAYERRVKYLLSQLKNQIKKVEQAEIELGKSHCKLSQLNAAKLEATKQLALYERDLETINQKIRRTKSEATEKSDYITIDFSSDMFRKQFGYTSKNANN